MALRPLRLRPHDVAVALELVRAPAPSYPVLAARTALSVGESHNSVRRLAAARLVEPDSRSVNKRALMEFLVQGVPYAFPAQLGPATAGVPTAHAGPLTGGAVRDAAMIVWPVPSGPERGASLAPLCPGAPTFVEENPVLYRWLTLVDALRVMDPRERGAVERVLRRELHEGAA
jgi:hypothetical protein